MASDSQTDPVVKIAMIGRSGAGRPYDQGRSAERRLAETRSALMDYHLGEEAERLRHRLRTLVEEHLPSDFLGACTDDPADLETTQRFCKLLAGEGLLAKA